MAAQHNIQYGQLKMFMTAEEIASGFGPSVWDRNQGEATRNVMPRKLAESKASGLYDSIAAEGVQEPVHLAHEGEGRTRRPMIAEGHHRVASAKEADPDRYVPVVHHRSLNDAGMYILDYE